MFGGSSFIAEEFCDDHPKYVDKVGGKYCGTATAEIITFNDIKEKLQEANPTYYQDLQDQWSKGQFYVLMGMQQDTEQRPIYKTFESLTPSRHLTVVFNLFVFMQIFNMICSRKIADQINIFDGIFSNPAFLIVWTIIVIIQILCAQLFGRFVSVH